MVYLYTLSGKYLCYAISTALSENVQSVISLSLGEGLPLKSKQRKNMLAEVEKTFAAKMNDYRNGTWNLSDEIGAIPARLWASYILDRASNWQLTTWKAAAVAQESKIMDHFTVNNTFDLLLCK
ncbi:hypothetical protein BWQ96_10221 [Gracilariopsis chorda]|uniref:Uncharacterized protein n=1 Tax=Gracilariopsis chorda TaxID=448386 RepID=A0A2V3IFW6_9FLOR|nr:hypothetical protein BWQ96_10221 [Gracilariopsis chorda]|eukprot:PXF40070.1 hypothetical protein BWQ96_10221 [Gracilariopsis chorda]